MHQFIKEFRSGDDVMCCVVFWCNVSGYMQVIQLAILLRQNDLCFRGLAIGSSRSEGVRRLLH